MSNKSSGFTLIEILLVVGILALLASAIIVAINPGRQFAKARNTQRYGEINAILSAIVQNMTDNQGRWNCPGSTYYATSLPSATVTIVTAAETDNTQINLSCLVPTYIPRIPVDPSRDPTDTNTGYTLWHSPTSGRIVICAPQAELGETICTTR